MMDINMTVVSPIQNADFLERAKISYITYELKKGLTTFVPDNLLSPPNARKKFEYAHLNG
jgi:hypothetical protein